MYGNCTPQSVNFVVVGFFFSCIPKITLSGAFFPCLLLTEKRKEKLNPEVNAAEHSGRMGYIPLGRRY